MTITTKTIIVTTLLLISLISTATIVPNKEPVLVIGSTLLCNLYFFFEYKLFRKNKEVVIALTITLVISIIGFLLNILPEFIATPFLTILIILTARNYFKKINHEEPETAARGYALVNQRDRTYSWILINILLLITIVSLVQPWEKNRTKLLLIPAFIFAIQLPLIAIFIIVNKVFESRRARKREVKRQIGKENK